jgi:hypothetical protein
MTDDKVVVLLSEAGVEVLNARCRPIRFVFFRFKAAKNHQDGNRTSTSAMSDASTAMHAAMTHACRPIGLRDILLRQN